MNKLKINNRRYLGSKFKLLDFIEQVLEKNTKNCSSFLDLFAGTGIVGNHFNTKYNIIVNDILTSNYYSYSCFLSNEKYDEIKIIKIINKYNFLKSTKENYYSKNFANTYLSRKNMIKIGYIRDNIDFLFKTNQINFKEKSILITSLLYAIDKIANTVGHYDSYRKTGNLDKNLILKIPEIEQIYNENNSIFQQDANELVKKINADIVYIDPPYNSRQYADNYHFLENIALNQKPNVFGVAKKMDRTNLKSKYSMSRATETFSNLIENLNCKYILFSYNNTFDKANSRSNAKMSDEDILKILNKKGEVKIFTKNFSPFTVGKTNLKEHKERIFFCKVKNINSKKIFKDLSYKKVITQSPLNYTGGKFKILNQLFEKMPKKINTFYDVFCGGFNVGNNIEANAIVAIDSNFYLIKLLKFLQYSNYENLIEIIEEKIAYYKLSDTYKNSYNFYNSNSSDGLGKFNKSAFVKLKKDYNATKNDLLLLLLIFYSFNNQIRFNKKGEFNSPVGKRDFNAKLRKKLKNFMSNNKISKIEFKNLDFKQINIEKLSEGDFVYCDPPYLLALASYNENNQWNQSKDLELYNFLDNCNNKGIKFALSNVIEHKGLVNDKLLQWSLLNSYNIIYLNHNYKNSSYQLKNKNFITKEVLITNY